MRYSIWYSNKNTQLILTIIINKINYRFRLPRPTLSEARPMRASPFLATPLVQQTANAFAV